MDGVGAARLGVVIVIPGVGMIERGTVGGGHQARRWLRVDEVAAVMRVSRTSVHRLIKAGSLPGIRVGRTVYVAESAVDDHLRQSWRSG